MLYYKPLTVYSLTTKMREETLKITIFNKRIQFAWQNLDGRITGFEECIVRSKILSSIYYIIDLQGFLSGIICSKICYTTSNNSKLILANCLTFKVYHSKIIFINWFLVGISFCHGVKQGLRCTFIIGLIRINYL